MESSKFSVAQRNRLPTNPGVYRFYDKKDKLIYVGKAKNIRKRVASYFTKTHGINRKTKKLSEEILAIEYTIANSEFDALLLENNLIKANQPKYNILLKDDKTFPYICIVQERFPRIISTRTYDPSKGEYFGPYTSVVAMKSVLDLIRKLYTIRTCKQKLSISIIEVQRFIDCLEYIIGNCLGPSEHKQKEENYNQEIDQAIDAFLNHEWVRTMFLKKTTRQIQFFKEHVSTEIGFCLLSCKLIHFFLHAHYYNDIL